MAPSLHPPGTRIGPYTIVRPLGRGTTCHVYEAHRDGVGYPIALKVLLPIMAQHPELRARFLREAEVAMRMRHPNLVAVYDAGEVDGVALLAMERLDGEDLQTKLTREHRLSVGDAVAILVPVCRGVAEAHRLGVAHRDLKPANIFLSRAPTGEIVPKVLDFGTARILDDDRAPAGDDENLTGTGVLLGTAHYMAPEQCLGAKHATHDSDQYALGVILYQCVTGRLPHQGRTSLATLRAILRDPPQPPERHITGLPPGFSAVVMRALQRDAAERFPSVTVLGAELAAFAPERVGPIVHGAWDEDATRPAVSLHELRGESPLVITAPPPRAPAARRGVPWLVLAGATLGAALGALLALWMLRRG